MKLDEGSAGRVYIVERVTLELTLERRLEALGILPGTRITVLNRKDRGALIIYVRGTRFAIGAGIAQNIEVREAAA